MLYLGRKKKKKIFESIFNWIIYILVNYLLLTGWIEKRSILRAVTKKDAYECIVKCSIKYLVPNWPEDYFVFLWYGIFSLVYCCYCRFNFESK